MKRRKIAALAVSFAIGMSAGSVAAQDSTWMQKVSREIQQSEYLVHENVGDGRRPDRLIAVNRAQDFRLSFQAAGLSISPRTDRADGWAFAMSFAGVNGRGVQEAVEIVRPDFDGRTVTYRRDGITETYTNGGRGLQLRVGLTEATGFDENSSLVFEVGTDLDALANAEGSHVDYYLAGNRVIRVSVAGQTSEQHGSRQLQVSGNKLIVAAQRSGVHLQVNGRLAADTQVGPSTTPDRVLAGEQTGSGFGISIASAGDVNGDGSSDVIVGAPEYDIGQPASAGRVLVYLGSVDGLSTDPIWTADGVTDNERFGASVSSAGDVNSDGYFDVIAGAPGSNSARVYPGSASGIQDAPREINGNSGDFGSVVSAAGDVNDDGLTDIVIGAPADPGGGRAEIHFAPFDGSIAATNLSVPGQSCRIFPASTVCAQDGGNGPFAAFGFSAASAGDVDGDGLADVVVGAPYYSFADGNQCRSTGGAFVYLGANLIPGTNRGQADWCSETIDTFVFQPDNYAGAELGYAVSTAGDIDGDGFDDIVVGSPEWNYKGCQDCATHPDVGAALVYRSACDSTPCLAATPLELVWAAIGVLDDPWNVGIRFGESVATAGDVNGDGIADIVVGAPDQEDTTVTNGAAYLYLGSTATVPMPLTGSNELFNVFGNSALTDTQIALRDSADWSITGTTRGGRLGRVVAGAGDTDGDGFSDLLVSATGRSSVFRGASFSPNQTRFGNTIAGAALASAGDIDGDGLDDIVVRRNTSIIALKASATRFPSAVSWPLQNSSAGNEPIAGAGDVNGDGFADILIGRPSIGRVDVYAGPSPGTTPDWTISSASGAFGTSAASAGDVNGDGYSDIVVGDPGFDDGLGSTGKAWVFLGSDTGLVGGPAVDDSQAIWTATGFKSGARFGASVSGAGDINGDGYSDVIVGAPGDGLADSGQAYVYLGSLATPLNVLSWIGSGAGQPGAEYGAAVASAGDIDGDGFDDIIVGAPGTTLFGDNNVGQAFSYHGADAGIDLFESWSFSGIRLDERLGAELSFAGDANADGLADVMVGGLLFLGSPPGLSSTSAWPGGGVPSSADSRPMSGSADINGDGFGDVIVANSGVISAHLGNVVKHNSGIRAGIARVPRQLQRSGTIVSPLGRLDSGSGTSFEIQARRPDAPGSYALQWEAIPLGVPFSGNDIRQGSWVPFGPGDPATNLGEIVDRLDAGTALRWRARVLSQSVAVPHSPWLRLSSGAPGAHLLTAGARSAEPFRLLAPAQNLAVFADSPPLVFQWHSGGNSSFEIEWSGNDAITGSVVSSGNLAASGNDIEMYIPDGPMWRDILRTANNPDFREAPVFWRIDTGAGGVSQVRALRLAAASAPLISSPADGQTAFVAPTIAWERSHNDVFQILFSARDFLGEPVIVVADADDTPDSADDFGITGTSLTIPDGAWASVTALVPPDADGTGTVYFAIRGRDSLGRTSTSDVRALKVSATGVASNNGAQNTSSGGGGLSVWWLFLLLAASFRCRRARTGVARPGRKTSQLLSVIH